MHDLVVHGGTVVDGTGGPARTADVAIDGGRISAVGTVTAPARETIDARGLVVTPGWSLRSRRAPSGCWPATSRA